MRKDVHEPLLVTTLLLLVQGGATPMHPGMTPSHPGAATPSRDNAWAPVMATPRHPSSEGSGRASAWEPAPIMSSMPAASGSGRASGWDQGPLAYSAPVTSIPQAGEFLPDTRFMPMLQFMLRVRPYRQYAFTQQSLYQPKAPVGGRASVWDERPLTHSVTFTPASDAFFAV